MTGIFINWKILGKENLTAKEKFITGHIANNSNSPCYLPNHQIDQIDKRETRRRLKSLEDKQILTREPLTPRAINLDENLLNKPNGLGLYIHPTIQNLPIAPSWKLVLAIKTAFPYMRKRTIADRLGMPYNTIKGINRQLNQLHSHIIHKALNSQNPSEGRVVLTPLGRVVLTPLGNNDILGKKRTNLLLCNKSSSLISPSHDGPTKEDKTMFIRKARITSIPTRKLDKWHKELEEEVGNLPHLTKHKFGSKSYKNSLKVVKGLANGLLTVIDKPTREAIYEKLSTMDYPGKKISIGEIKEVLTKKFSIEERLALYQRLSNLHSPKYWPKRKNGLPKSLANALFNPMTSMSWLIFLWLRPLNEMVEYNIVDIKQVEGLDEVVKMIIDVCPNFHSSQYKQLLKNVWDMYHEFVRVADSTFDRQRNYHWGTFDIFMKYMISYAESGRFSSHTPNIGWFKVGSKLWEAWLGPEMDNQLGVSSSDEGIDDFGHIITDLVGAF